MPNDPVVLSEEPESLKLKINDPTKPAPVKPTVQVKKIEPKPKAIDKAIGAFFGNDVNSQNVGEYVLKEWAEPTAKRMANNAAQGLLKKIGSAVQVLLFGKVLDNTNGPTDYTSFSKPGAVQPTQLPSAHKLMEEVEQFAFSSRTDALQVLEYLRGKIATFGSVSVLDYYEAVHEPVNYLMADKGWMDLSTAEVAVAPEGFVIKLPRPILLKRG